MQASRMAAAVFLGVAGAEGSTRGGPVALSNPSFELPRTNFAQPGADGWTTAGPTTFGAGIFRNTAAGQPDHISNAVGDQLAFMSTLAGTEFSQAVATDFEPGERYTLSVGVAISHVTPPQPGDTLRIELYYSTATRARQPVAFTDVTNDAATSLSDTALKYFSTTTPVIRAGDAFAGQPIGILFATTGAGGYLDLDDVTLAARPALPGDTNADGSVNFEDLLTLAQHYGQAGGLEDGDFNADGAVGFDDLLVLAQHYGQTAAALEPASPAQVPEPAVLSIFALAPTLRRRRP